MKKIVLLTFVLILLLVTLSLCIVDLLELQVAYASPYRSINVNTAYNMITNGSYPNLVALDVRTQNEYDSGHIYGAVWIPHTELEARIGELASHEDHEIIVYCKSGSRSVTASEVLDSHNFTKIYNMLEGISAWKSADYPVWIATVHNVNTTLNYDTIQAAIDTPQTLDGHTIFVEEGIYYEHVVVNKAISLVGEDKSTTVIDGNETAFCVNVTANNVAVTGFTVQKSDYGIVLDNSSYTLVSDNIVSDNDWGIYAKSDNNSIVRNVVTHNLDGIHLRGSYTTVAQNIFSSNSFSIYLYMCGNNTIVSNEVLNSGWGIELVHSRYVTVIGNIVSGSNGVGVAVAYGGNNTIYHNNVINNADQVFICQSHNNTWDNGVEGNYWSDYNGADPNHDGIGNTEYVIDANNTDHFPLMGMFSDFYATSEYHVQIVCNSTISDFQFNRTAIFFNVTGEDGTLGFCRICVPTDLMNRNYTVFVNGTGVQYDLLPCSNNTHSYLYFTYNHSKQEVIIIPEFPSFFILPLFMIATLLAVMLYRRKHPM